MEVLERYDWPGNVRELENMLERVLALSGKEIITSQDLSPALKRPDSTIDSIPLPAEGLEIEPFLDRVRQHLMGQALDITASNQTQAAELLGMTFRSFRYYAKKLGLTGDGPEEPNPVDEAAGADG
jgi:two-component system response regulator PilR (NtrC family)